MRSFTVTLTLLADDRNNIKAIEGLAKATGNTFLSFADTLVTDTAFVTNKVTAVASSAAEGVRTYTPDTTPPTLGSFDYDRSYGYLSLTFTEPVRVTTLALTTATTQSDQNSDAISRTLTGGVLQDPATVHGVKSFTVVLSVDDLAAIKITAGLAEDDPTTFISLAEGLVTDMENVFSAAIPTNNAPIRQCVYFSSKDHVATRLRPQSRAEHAYSHVH